MVHWPEPNDDPNIPYVWGLSGYSRRNLGDTPEVEVKSGPVPQNAPTNNNESLKILGGMSLTLGALGLYKGYVESDSKPASERILNTLASGVIYATIIGAVAETLKER